MKFEISSTTILIIGLLIAYQNSKIYVPEEFDGKLFYKLVYLAGKTVATLVKNK